MGHPFGMAEFSNVKDAPPPPCSSRPLAARPQGVRLLSVEGRTQGWLLVLLAVAAVGGGWWIFSERDPARVTRPFRVGFQESPPQQFVTPDQKLVYQQNIPRVGLAVVVLIARTNRLEDIAPLVPRLLEVLSDVRVGTVTRVGV